MFVSCALVWGCASDPSSNDYDPSYHQNLFYMGQGEQPNHQRKAHLDFFDKECSYSGGSDGYHGKIYSCHYSDQ